MNYKYDKGLVSIVTPCYNTGSILHRLFDSILSQDYPCIEMYAINDGSSDDTEDKIKEYIPKFKEKGYKMECINQPNGGQSSALNTGLKLVRGEFFIWPDSDDFFSSPRSISVFVDELKEREDISVVRCLPTFVDEETLETIRIEDWKEIYGSYDHFENCLHCNNFFWGAGNYMIRMRDFDKANPEREIFVEKKAGQNFQILLPVLYGNKCKTIKDSYYCILERSSSHSRSATNSYLKQMEIFSSYGRTILNTLNRMLKIDEYAIREYIRQEETRIAKRKFEIAVYYKKRHESREFYKKVKETNINWKLMVKYYLLLFFSK